MSAFGHPIPQPRFSAAYIKTATVAFKSVGCIAVYETGDIVNFVTENIPKAVV